MNGSPRNGKSRKIVVQEAFRLTSPDEERSAWNTAFLIMLFFSALAFTLEILNFIGVTQSPPFTLEFIVSIVYIPTALLTVGWAYSRTKRTTMPSSS